MIHLMSIREVWNLKNPNSLWWVLEVDAVLWWLILSVSLTGPRGVQIFRQTLFWVCLWECFHMQIRYELIDWVKQMWVVLIQSVEDLSKIKRLWAKGNVSSVFCLGHCFFLSRDLNWNSTTWVSSQLAFRLELHCGLSCSLTGTTPSALLDLYFVSRSWNYSTCIITWDNYLLSIFSDIYIHTYAYKININNKIYYWLC